MNKAQRIKHARTHPKTQEKPFTQVEVAESCGVTRAAVNQWESEDPDRNTSPKDESLEILAEITGYDVNWIRTGIDISSEVRDIDGAYAILPPHHRRLLKSLEQLTMREQWAILDLVNGLAEAKMVEVPPKKKPLTKEKIA